MTNKLHASKLPLAKPAKAQVLPSQLLPIDVAEQVDRIARIPDRDLGQFCDTLCDDVQRVWRRDRRSLPTRPGKALKRAAEAARKLHQELNSLTKADGEWLQSLLLQEPEHVQRQLIGRHPGYVDPLHEPTALDGLSITVFDLTALVVAAAGQVPPRVLGRARSSFKPGRRKGTVNDPTFHNFVASLLIAASAFGGFFTLDKNFKKGTLLEALDALRPYLPRGVIPYNLEPHLATLQRIKTAHEKYRRSPNNLLPANAAPTVTSLTGCRSQGEVDPENRTN
jgi:hypothetical protein